MTCIRCEELEEEVRQLKDELYGHGWKAPLEFRLTTQEEAFLQCLVAHPGARSHEFIISAICYGGQDIDSRMSQVIACKVRRKLRPFGVNIVTLWARGYQLEEPSRQRLLNWNRSSQDIAA